MQINNSSNRDKKRRDIFKKIELKKVQNCVLLCDFKSIALQNQGKRSSISRTLDSDFHLGLPHPIKTKKNSTYKENKRVQEQISMLRASKNCSPINELANLKLKELNASGKVLQQVLNVLNAFSDFKLHHKAINKKLRTQTHFSLPRAASVRVKNRCVESGRGRGIVSYFQLSRIKIRENACKGVVNGLKKASW